MQNRDTITQQSLPKSDIVESGYLENMLKNLSTSYKLFWFKGILHEIMVGEKELEFNKVVARMIAAAWYPVVFFNLSLGIADKLADTVWYICDTFDIPREESEDKIVEFILQCKDKKLAKMIKDFTDFVPYRLIRPFYQREIEYERKNDIYFKDGKVNGIIEKYNKNDLNNAFYILDRMNHVLTVSDKWIEYIKANIMVIEGWMNYKLIEYIQLRNPSVPAIPFKIFPPNQRKLTDATMYWDLVQNKIHLPDLYTNKEFSTRNMEQYGNISIDHFIPWSFVLHDELWNLYPAFKNVNSMKGNKLPDKDRYLNQFCEYQYQAFIIAKELPQIKKKTMEQYMTIKRDIFNIGEGDQGHEVFLNSIRNTIEPLYQIANNQGYGIWWYD
ncbi:MAG: HNH endonuclease domain-containing protein [Mobilitalea sp.]